MAKSIVFCTVFTFLVLGCIAVFIVWLADNMKSPTFVIDQAEIKDYNFTADNRLNATFTFVVRSHNRDPKYKIKYKVMILSVYRSGLTIAYNKLLGPYSQNHGEDLVFTAQLMAQNNFISSDIGRDIRNENRAGQLGFHVRIRATVNYEVERWKHRSYILRIICKPVVISLTSGKASQSINCEYDKEHLDMKYDLEKNLEFGVVWTLPCED